MQKKTFTKIENFIKEHLIERKMMFMPILCVFTFMLVGYAAIDKESPIIVSDSIDVPYGLEFDQDLIDIVDNQATRDLIKVVIDEKSLDINQLGKYTIEVSATDDFDNTTHKEVVVNVIDTKGPEFEFVGQSEGYVVQVPVGGSAELTSYIKAIDNVEGDVSAFIEANDQLNTNELGSQIITVKASDTSGNTTTETYEFLIGDFTAPTITLLKGSDAKINFGSTYNTNELFEVKDNFDTEVKTTVTGSVDTSKLGDTQKITMVAVDGSGNEAKQEITLTVADLEAPVIKLSRTSIDAKMNESINIAQYVVSANDNVDGDLISSVTVSGISTASTGVKKATVTVSDKAGNSATQTISVNVYNPNGSVYANKVVAAAMSKVGSPYVYGATGPYAFDCSGLTSWAFRQAGISIPRTSSGQAAGGSYVSKSQLLPGDLVFFAFGGGRVDHVGIYIGGGKMVHAGDESTGVYVSSINIRGYAGARRY